VTKTNPTPLAALLCELVITSSREARTNTVKPSGSLSLQIFDPDTPS